MANSIFVRKEDEKEQRLAAKKNREEGNFPAENQS